MGAQASQYAAAAWASGADADGNLVALSAVQGPDLATLRRAQALAATSPVGLALAHSVLAQKLAGQAALLSELPGGERTRP